MRNRAFGANAILVSVLVMGTMATTPALAGWQGGNFGIGGEHLNDETCHSVKKAERIIKRRYTNVQYEAKYSNERIYFFYATKPKNERISWHLYYDSCEKEIIRKESQE